MRKASAIVLSAVMMMTGAITCNAGAIAWGYSADLGGTYSVGWLVQLYEDVSQNGFGAGGTFGGDDTLVAGVTDVLVSSRGAIGWGSSFTAPAGSLALGDHVYSVVYDAATIGAATQYHIIDASPFVLPAADQDATYNLGVVANSWQPIVPEPATMSLLGLGLVTLASRSIRRKKQ